MTSGSLWNYHRDKMNDDANENDANNYKIDESITVTGKSFEYKTKIIGSTLADDITLDTDVVVTLIYLSNFWRSLILSLINCKTELHLS